MNAKAVANLPKAISALESRLDDLPDHTAKQIALIELINEYTGSTFTGFNLNDPLGRFVGCVLWPMPPERIKIVTELGPTLNALLLASPIHRLIWDFGPNRAFAMPEAILHGSQAYKYAFKVAGMHHIGWYDYPPDKDQNHVIVVISRPDRGFSPTEIRTLQSICDKFYAVINRVASGGQLAPGFFQVSDHSLELDAEFRPICISAYAHALIALFYSPLRAQGTLLPEELLKDVRVALKESVASVLPTSDGAHCAFTKRTQGRQLCVVVNSSKDRQFRLTIYEDMKQLERLRQIKNVCRDLRRDKYTTLAVCLSLLDGANNDASIRAASGMASHKASSVRRIISKARALVSRV